MRKMDTKGWIRLASIMLFFVMFAVWILFYFVTSNHIAESTEQQMELAAMQLIERLGSEFSQAERLLYNLKRNEDVRAIILADEPEAFLPLMRSISSSLGVVSINQDILEHIIIFANDQRFFRLAGNLGNKSSSRLFDVISSTNMPNHLAVNLDGRNYIGYADEIQLDSGGKTGAAVILIEEEKILEILNAYDQSGSLFVAIRADGEVVASNTERVDLLRFDMGDLSVIHSRLGITPYVISVAGRPQYMSDSVRYFTIVALITAALFTAVLFMYADVLKRRFFRPMMETIGSIERIDVEDLNAEVGAQTLPYVQSEEFDGLIDKINEMLTNIDRKNNEVKTAEIEKQKALIFSLKKQINAHFTINTLNTIRMLAEQDDFEKAESVSMGLISLIRYAYDENELINIWDELGILRDYIFIMNSRYDNKLAVDFDFDDRLMNYDMPRMLLQPIIENSILHGFIGMDSGCQICVKAELRGDVVFFSVSDNGRGMGTDELAAVNSKLSIMPDAAKGYKNIALRNIKNRLYNYYGNAGWLYISAAGKTGVEVTITLPIRRRVVA